MKVFIYTMVIDGKLKIKIRHLLKIFLLKIYVQYSRVMYN